MTQLKIGSLFSGYGGLDLATEAFFDADTVWHVEFDDAPSRILDEHWPDVPNYGDVTAVDWTAVEPIDILTGGFPCQDLSLAGRRAGMRPGTRSGLWADFAKAIAALNPSVVIIENVRGLLSGCAESDLGPCPGCVGDGEHRPALRALGRVLGDLADLGFDAEWASLLASDVGAPHGRLRVFVVAYRPEVRHDPRFPSALHVAQRWADAEPARRAAGPVGPLFRTPAAAEAEGGRRNPDREGATMRLSDQVLEEQERGILLPTPKATDQAAGSPAEEERRSPGLRAVGALFPTPAAMNPNDEEDLDNWLARRERVKETKQNGNGFGTPLGVAVRMLPTPQVADANGSHKTRSGGRSDELLLPGVAAEAQAIGWGPYQAAVERWERMTRFAPTPTLPDGRDGAHRLNAAFAEWMMGLPSGWVTSPIIGLTRREQLKACGNGVVPQQAYAALEGLWPRVLEAAA